ncbi:MAG: hypothetical protein FWH14_06690, partial [Oscillospiraceae bacterium]|nr:hypothetical protein [Oscillospiraceae bacterium]
KPPFPSGEGCRRSGGVVCRDDRPRSSVVTAAGVFLWLSQILYITLALPLGELSAATPTERAQNTI